MKLAPLIAATVSICALATTSVAAAQVPPPAPGTPEEATPDAQVTQADDTTGEIIVTAQFRAQSVQKTPLAITALNAELLDAKGITDIIGAANLAPNVQLSSSSTGYGGTAAIYIRGVGQRDPSFAVEPGVGMYVNDIYYGVLSGAVFELVDIDRIEVLRGPQGTLFGKNSIGGAIRLFSKRPSAETDAFVEVGVGSRNALSGKGATNVTLAEGSLYGRVAFGARHIDGYVDRLDYACATGSAGASNRTSGDCRLGRQGGREILSGRASLLWTPNSTIENLLIFDATRDRSENPAVKTLTQSALWAGSANYITGDKGYVNYENYQVVPTSGPSAGVPYTMPDRTPVDAWGLSNTLTAQLGDDLSLTSITGFRKSDVTIASAVDGSPASISDQVWNLKHQQFSQELRLSGQVSSLLDWTVGGFYYKAKGTSSGRLTIAGGLALGGGGVNLDTLFEDPVETTSKSAFVHTVLHPAEGLNITGAVRYSEDQKDFSFNRYSSNGDLHPQLGALTGLAVKFKSDRIDYRLVADYQFTSGVLGYAQVSTGFKGGGINPRPFFVTQALPYEPETLTSYEAGVKTRFFDRKVTLNLAGFINDYSEFQSTLLRCDAISPFPGAPCSQSTNVGDARIKGLEAELSAQPVAGLNIDASAGYLDFQYTRVNPQTGITLDMINEYTPKWTASAGVQYRAEIGNRGSLTPRFDLSYRSTVQTRAVNDATSALPARALVGAKLTWRDKASDWQVEASVSNLFDKFYLNSAYVLPNAPYFSGVGVVGEPRTFMLSLRRNFN